MKHFSIKKLDGDDTVYIFNRGVPGYIMQYRWLESLKNAKNVLLSDEGDKDDLIKAALSAIQNKLF